MRKHALLFIFFFLLPLSLPLSPLLTCAHGKKVAYIASYHVEKGEWTSGIKAGIEETLRNRPDVSLEIFNMDTRLSKTDGEKQAAALLAKQFIEQVSPDIVITSDDNAAKFLIQPYYKNSSIPFVFCGINWDASVYGLPYQNTTGMIEIQLIGRIVDYLKPLAKGNRIAALRGNTLTNRKEQGHFENQLNQKMDARYVETFREWKEEFLNLQDNADILILGSLGALDLEGTPMGEIEEFVAENIKIPTAAYDTFMNRIALLTLSTIPEEQGQWAAEKALAILDGARPDTIPVVRNKKARIFLNMKLAKKLSIKFPMELIDISHLISAKLPKVLYINSYHQGYKWSDDIEKGLKKSLKITTGPDGNLDMSDSPVEFEIFRMDTKNKSLDSEKKAAAEKARDVIKQWRPDLVIASDDNVSKFLIAPYYKNSELPFVFCGINWDASIYGFPAPNITGMVEVAPVAETINLLKNFTDGERLAYLGADDLSNRKELEYHNRIFNITYSGGSLVSTFNEWKKEYLQLQSDNDMLILFNPVGIKGWNEKEAQRFILANTKIPTGAVGDNVVHLTLLGKVNVGEEQGWWAGKTALKILNGTAPSAIPITTNRNSRIILNTSLAKSMGVIFPIELLEEATLISEEAQP